VVCIATATQTPTGYLAKVLQSLAKAGVVIGQRGLHGGFTLTREPQDISVLEIINAVDPIQRIQRCPLGNPAHVESLCRLHRRLDDAIAMIESSFRDATVADLMTEATFLDIPKPE
jgi:Rrf2 family protein